MTGLVKVPTVADLGRRGHAVERTHTVYSPTTGETRQDTRWEITPAGYAEMRDAMAQNGRILADEARAHEAVVAERRAEAHRRALATGATS